MSTPPAHKRRRVDSLGIHKPFVSPLKRNASTNTASTPAPSRTHPTPSTPYTPLRSSNLKTSTPLHPHIQDPEIVQAQQAIKNLEAKIRVLRSQNGILSQAVQITTIPATSSQPSSGSATSTSHSSTSTQPRLIRLSQKWKKASQQAAEEVFSSFSQNIKDNGGYTTYLQNQRQNTTSASAFFNDEDDTKDATNEEDWRDEDGDVLTERGKRQRRGEMQEKEHGYKQQREDEGGDEEGEEEEEELSLGTMLQVLNIDPEVIGWDSKTLAWK
jgi:Swi5-dependent recombination DNA repair protein 1